MESIETLNQRLIEYFGIDTVTGQAMFRIVWSDDQTEKRLMPTLDSGVQLLHPEIREVKKYPYMEHLYVLERLVLVPDVNKEELAGLKMSYEPIWAYCYEDRTPVRPYWEATKFIVDTLYAAMGKTSLRKYVESEEESDTPEGRELRCDKIRDEIFGNETDTGDALAHKQGIVVPRNYTKES